MLSFYYAFLFSDRKYLNHHKIKNMIEYLVHIQYKKLKSKDPKFQRFTSYCYGYQKQIRNLRLNKWKKIEENKNPKLKAYKAARNKKLVDLFKI